MSYIAKLKEQAQSLRDREQAEAEARAKRQAIYLEKINPALQRIGRFLAELTDDLNYVKPDVGTDYQIIEGKTLKGLKHTHYVVYIDSNEQTKSISMLIQSEGPKPLEFWIDQQKNAEKITEFLFNHKVNFKQHKITSGDYKTLRSQFQVLPKMTARFDFSADVLRSKIILTVSNFEEIGSQSYILAPDQITDGFLEDLAEYIVRNKGNFLTTELDSDVKQRIRTMVEAERQQQQQELESMEQGNEPKKTGAALLKGFMRFQ